MALKLAGESSQGGLEKIETIAGLGTATHVYCSVRVDVDDANHELFSEDWTSTGAKLDAVDTHSGAKSTIFDLLKDGASHTFYFLLWAGVASQATIDIVQLWEAVGSCSTGTSGQEVIELDHTGLVSISTYLIKEGTGTVGGRFTYKDDAWAILKECGAGFTGIESAIVDEPRLRIKGTVATDLNYAEMVL